MKLLQQNNFQVKIDLGRAVHTLTRALDYVGIDDRSHGRRVGLICHRLAYALQWGRKQRHFMLLAGMLHDCGVSSTNMHKKLVDEIEWSGSEEHCLRGASFLSGFGPFKPYEKTIRYHHTRWCDFPKECDEQVQDTANLIFLADRMDVIYAQFAAQNEWYKVLENKEMLVAKLEPYVGRLFNPVFYEALKLAARRDSFWLELQDEFLDGCIFDVFASEDYQTFLDFDEVEHLGELLSKVVDAKSPFTHYHSLRVADLVYILSKDFGYNEQERRTLRIAALLHDLGKLRTPDEILEKPTNLDDYERLQMRRHPMDSYHVLHAIFPYTDIAKWAAHHHEKLNGTGYPYGWKGDEIDHPTRILTICDIFQALCQKRPYRNRLQVHEVISIMKSMVDNKEIDKEIFQTVVEKQDVLYEIAIKEG